MITVEVSKGHPAQGQDKVVNVSVKRAWICSARSSEGAPEMFIVYYQEEPRYVSDGSAAQKTPIPDTRLAYSTDNYSDTFLYFTFILPDTLIRLYTVDSSLDYLQASCIRYSTRGLARDTLNRLKLHIISLHINCFLSAKCHYMTSLRPR